MTRSNHRKVCGGMQKHQGYGADVDEGIVDAMV
jgi:hypothetical protein